MRIASRTVYECEYCGKLSKSKTGIKLHEKTCKSNPVNQTYCYDCEHSVNRVKEYTAYGDIEDMYLERVAKHAPYCSHFGTYLIAPVIARKQWFKLQVDEMLMPVVLNSKCEHYMKRTIEKLMEQGF